MENGEHLFVYGTLMRAMGHPMYEWLARGAEFVARATVSGTLYDLGEYPGFLPEGEGRVWGELYRLRDPDEVLRQLDRYEGCDGSYGPAEYRRQRRTVCWADGRCCEAWIYVYNLEVSDDMKIEDGDYFRYRKRKAHAKTRT